MQKIKYCKCSGLYCCVFCVDNTRIQGLRPECVCCEIALTSTSGFQFDKCPTRRIKGAHEGNADTEYH